MTAREGGLATFTVAGVDDGAVGEASKQATGNAKDAKTCK